MIPAHCHERSLASITTPHSVLRALNQFQNEGYSKWQLGLFEFSDFFFLLHLKKCRKFPITAPFTPFISFINP